jgi:hypothetical protein
MSRDLRIDVNVNPNGVASPTQTRTTETPEANQIQNRTAGNYVAASAIVSLVQRGISRAASNIGELTGNSTAARKNRIGWSNCSIDLCSKYQPRRSTLNLGNANCNPSSTAIN